MTRCPVKGDKTHQEGAEHVEADEVEDGEAAAAGVVIHDAVNLRIRVTHLVGETGQHNLLPGFTRRTSVGATQFNGGEMIL